MHRECLVAGDQLRWGKLGLRGYLGLDILTTCKEKEGLD